MSKDKKKFSVLIVGFPYGGNGSSSTEVPEVGYWLAKTLLKMRKDKRIAHAGYHYISDTPITMTRNRSIEIAKEEGMDFLLMVDSDQYPDVELDNDDPEARPFWDSSFDFAMKHYEKGPVIIGAPYCGPPVAEENVYVFHWNSKITGNPQPDYSITAFTRFEAQQRAGIEPVAALPTGLILIDMRIFEHLVPPYFYYEWKDKRLQCEKASTEDVVFTRNASMSVQLKLGYNPVMCNWDSWAGHWKPKCVRKPRVIGAAGVADIMKNAYETGYNHEDKIYHVHNLGGKPVITDVVTPGWAVEDTEREDD